MSHNDAEVTKKIHKLTNEMKNLKNQSDALQTNTQQTQSTIQNSIKQISEQRAILDQKRTILLTRNRMLQLGQDRNEYMQRVIYTLLALIGAGALIVLIGFTSFNPRK